MDVKSPSKVKDNEFLNVFLLTKTVNLNESQVD